MVTKQATRNGKEKGEENEPQAAGSKDGGAVSGKAVEGKAEKKRVRVSWMRHALLQESTWKKAPQLIATSPDRMRVWVREVLGHSDHVEWVQLEAMVR